ncbi:hypothetical protein OBK05_10875 [Empedobacter falsenii]
MNIIEQVPDDTSFLDRGLGVGSLVPTSYTNYGLPEGTNLANFTPPQRESFSRKRELADEQPKDVYVSETYKSFSNQNNIRSTPTIERESYSNSRKRDRELTGEQPKDIYIPKVYESFSEQNTSPFYEYGNYDINDNYTRKDDGSFVKKYDYYKHGVGGYNEANNDIVVYGIWGVIALLILFLIIYADKTFNPSAKAEIKKPDQSTREYSFSKFKNGLSLSYQNSNGIKVKKDVNFIDVSIVEDLFFSDRYYIIEILEKNNKRTVYKTSKGFEVDDGFVLENVVCFIQIQNDSSSIVIIHNQTGNAIKLK